MINIILGLQGAGSIGDLNHDGVTNVVDVQALINTILGFSICPP